MTNGLETDLSRLVRHLQNRAGKELAQLHAAGHCTAVGGTIVHDVHAQPNASATLLCWVCEERPASPYQLTQKLPMCVRCFSLCFRVLIGPHIAAVNDKSSNELCSRIEAAFEFASPLRPTAGEQLMARTSLNSWACPRCTFVNFAEAPCCEVCGCVTPKVLRCIYCQQRVGNVTPREKERSTFTMQSQCPKLNKLHLVWECDTCTVINTVDSEQCLTCGTLRTWKCPRCHSTNRTKKSSYGELYCSVCGHCQVVLTPSVMKRMGIDPEEAKREEAREKELLHNTARLQARLRSIGLNRSPQVGDGNCQFRSLSSQLLGSPDYHMLVRHVAVQHMIENQADFVALFESSAAFERYIATMKNAGTWGDQITLRAVADAFGVHIHLITSDEKRWYYHFSPKDSAEESPSASPVKDTASAARTATNLPCEPQAARPRLFLMYLYPVHYDDVTPVPPVPSVDESLLKLIQQMIAEEDEWDDVGNAPVKSEMVLTTCSQFVNLTFERKKKTWKIGGDAKTEEKDANRQPSSLAQRSTSEEGWLNVDAEDDDPTHSRAKAQPTAKESRSEMPPAQQQGKTPPPPPQKIVVHLTTAPSREVKT